MDMRWNGAVIRRIIRTVEIHPPVLQHFQELVHLHRVQFADFVQKQNAAMRARYRAGFGLRHALRAERACTLVNRIVNGADQRVCNCAFVETHTGSIHFDKRRFRVKWGFRVSLGLLQHKACRAGFPHTRRAVQQHMLRVFAAQRRAQRADAVRLPHDILHAGRPCQFR